MKFKGKKNAIIWDSKRNRPLCAVDKQGVITTKDEYTIMRLKELGYVATEQEAVAESVKVDKVTPVTEEKPAEAVQAPGADVMKMTKPELIKICKDKGLTGYSNKTVAQLREILASE